MLLNELKLTVKKMPVLFIILLLVQSILLAFILFYFGIYRNNKLELDDAIQKESTITVNFYTNRDRDEAVNPDWWSECNSSKLKDAFPGLASELGNHCVSVSVSGYADVQVYRSDEYVYPIRNSEGKIVAGVSVGFPVYFDGTSYSDKPSEGLKETTGNDTWFTLEMIENGEKVCLAPGMYVKSGEDTIRIAGEEYRVIDKTGKAINGIIVPLESLPDTMYNLHMTVWFDRPLTKSESYKITGVLQKALDVPESQIFDYASADTGEKQTWYSLMLVSVLFSLVAAVITGIIYRFLYRQREYDTAVFEICGASQKDIIRMYMAEMSAVLLFSVCLGYLFFDKVLYASNRKKYGWFDVIFTAKTKLMIIAVYLVIIFTVIIISARKACSRPPRQILGDRR